VLVGSLGTLAIALTARRLAGAAAARFAALVVTLMPIAAGGLVLATPDAPLFATVAFTVLALVMAVQRDLDGTGGSLVLWLLAGVAIGLAMASKFTAVLVPVGVLAGVSLHPRLRPLLRAPGPWLAVAVASLLMLPVLRWNAAHDWVAFGFQLEHGFGAVPVGGVVSREVALLLTQLGLVSPILFVLFAMEIVASAGKRGEPVRSMLAVVAAGIVCFFAVSALRRPVEGNWPAIAWVPAMVLIAAARRGSRTAWERRGVFLAGTLSALGLAHVLVPFLPIPPRRDSSIKAHGWERVAAHVDSLRRVRGDDLALAVNKYQDGALLAFQLADHPTVYALNIDARGNQYDLWPPFRSQAARGAGMLLLLDLREESEDPIPVPVKRLSPYFDSVERGEVVPLVRGADVYGHRRAWLLTGWSGEWPSDSVLPPSP
jgi:4-amino-4-deoxy-L-arabinose transferase-like glycosyltransferase